MTPRQDSRPFAPGKDAHRYLVQVLLLTGLVNAGLALLVSGGAEVPGVVLIGIAAVVMLRVIRPRANRLSVPSEWPVASWNVRAREMDVLRLRHIRAALRDSGLPDVLAYVLLALVVLVITYAVFTNRDTYF